MGDSYPGSQNKFAIPNVGEKVAEAEIAFGHGDVRTTRLRLFHFFRAARKHGLIGGLNPRTPHLLDPAIDNLVELIQAKSKRLGFKAESLRSLASTDAARVDINTDFIRHIVDAVPKTSWFNEDPRVRELWRDLVDQEVGYIPHLNRRLHFGGESVLQSTNCDMLGDYVLFRLDDPGLVRIAFFRFYAHTTGGVRSMGLRLDRRYGFISSKGWVSKQESDYLVAGYIIDRRNRNALPLPAGGFSLMSVTRSASNALYISGKTGLAMAPVIHMQAPYALPASCAPGILIRLFGAEKYANRYIEDKLERNRSIRDLQEMLSDYFSDLVGGTGMSIMDSCELLAGAAGISIDFFLGDEDHRGAFEITEPGIDRWKYKPCPLTSISLNANPERIREPEDVGIRFKPD